MYVNKTDTLLDLLTVALAVGGPYNATKVALYHNDITPSRNSALTDFTITDFGGLTNLKAITWGTPFLNGNQQAEALGGLLAWLTTAATLLPITAYGYVIVDTTAAVLILAERFANPFTFNAAGDQMALVPRLVIDT